MGGVRKTFERDGQTVRVCRECGHEFPLTGEHFSPAKRNPDGSVAVYHGACKPCATAVKARWRKGIIEAGGPQAAKLREQRRRIQSAWRKANPDRYRAIQKRRAARVKADPIRHAEDLERRRIEHRMRAERKGKPVSRSFRKVAKVERAPRRVPVGPLLNLIERTVERRQAVAGITGEVYRTDGIVKEVCNDLGISDRTYRRWRQENGGANIGLVEKVLLEAGVEWHEVYSYDDHAAAFLAVEVEA